MTVTLTQIKTIHSLSNVTNIEAELFYPKVILIENHRSVYAINLITNNEINAEKSENHRFEENILDKLLLEHFLWLVLESGEIIVIDILKDSRITINNDQNISLKLQKLVEYNNRLCFLSDSGDTFEVSCHVKELVKKLKQNASEIALPFKKAHISHAVFKTKIHTICGTSAFVDAGMLMIKCPTTGLLETVSTDNKINLIATWRDYGIFGNDCNMWLTDIRSGQIIHGFEKSEGSYYPILAHNDIFYYLLWNNEEVNFLLNTTILLFLRVSM